jgi:hypothetical protein
MSSDLLLPERTIAPGRACGSCTLCCKVFKIPAIDKPAGRWCQNCTPGKGCGIYETRPDQCRDFYCLWLTEATIPAEWKPERSKMVLSIFPENGFIYVQVDPGAPQAWKKQPYYGQLHQWAADNLNKGVHVLVVVNETVTLIMPNQDLPLGTMKPTDGFAIRGKAGPMGVEYEVVREGR